MPAQILITLLLVGIGWYVIVRPQKERIRQQQATVASLEVGDRVITAGGIHGILVEVAEETVRIEVAPGTVLTLARPAIARRVDAVADTDTNPTNGSTL